MPENNGEAFRPAGETERKSLAEKEEKKQKMLLTRNAAFGQTDDNSPRRCTKEPEKIVV